MQFNQYNLQQILEELELNSYENPDKLEELKRTVQHFPEGIVITDETALILHANSAWEKLTGYSLEEIKGKPLTFLTSRKTPPRVFKSMWKKLQAKDVFNSDEIINTRKDNTEYNVRTTTFPVYANKKIVYYLQIQEDITKQKEMERLKKEFLSTATHELKTPITTLKLLIQSHMRNCHQSSKSKNEKQILSMIESELDRLTRLINELLDVSRIETNRLKLHPSVFSINKLIDTVINKMNLIAEKRKFIFYYDEQLNILADEDKIEQVLVNFITNAIKYSPDHTPITIELKKAGQFAEVSIKDHGKGIAKKHLPFLFSKYYQVSSTSQGFGLGLYIVKEIIKSHKGKVWIKSKHLEGSTFFFALRIVD